MVQKATDLLFFRYRTKEEYGEENGSARDEEKKATFRNKSKREGRLHGTEARNSNPHQQKGDQLRGITGMRRKRGYVERG